jgi:VWFA-related protein
LVDVVVTKNGAPVKGLTKDKFRVLENGKEQDLKVFEAHSEDEQTATATNAPSAKTPTLPPNTYSDFTPYPPSSAVNILLLDALNTPSTDQAYVRKQMLAYLKNIPPGTRMAVFTLASRLRMVQGFTADAGLLAKAVSSKDYGAESIAVDKSSEAAATDLSQGLMAASNHCGLCAMSAVDMLQFAADLKSFNTDQREEMTLVALKQIAHYLGTIPGRKNLIWFSGSFPLSIDPGPPDARNPDPTKTARDYAEDVRETDRLLTAARIAVYTVDARGLLPPESAIDASTDPGSVLGVTAMGRAGAELRQMTTVQNQAADETYLRDQSLQQIAADTGGKAFVNTNGFQEAIKQALADGTNYYTIGYMPQWKDDGGFRRIKVNVDGSYQLAYRDGYYAASPGHGIGSGASTTKEAVQFGAPPPSDILFKVRVITSSDPVANGFTPAPGLAGANAKTLKPPLTRYLIDYIVDAHHFTYRKTPDGLAHTRLEFTVLAYDVEGKVLNFTDNGFALDLPPELYAQFMSGGFPQHQEIDLPAGQVFLRIVVRDLDSTNAGATEVPLTVAKN